MDPNNQPGPTQQPVQPPQTPANGFAPPTPQPKPSDPYSFIMDTEHKPKNSFSPNHNSLKSRLLVVGGVGIGLIIAIVVVSSLISGGKEDNAQLLTGLAAQQTEIIRVANLGLKDSTDPTTLAYAQTTKLSVMAEQSALIKYLASKKVKVTPVQLNAKLDKDTDKALESADASNQYDETLTTTLKKGLQAYASNIKTSYDSASNENSKKILKDSYASTLTLLK